MGQGRSGWEKEGGMETGRGAGKPNGGSPATPPLVCQDPPSPFTQAEYLGSWLQGRHEVFDHLGFRDCHPAHHEEDQERVVAGMGPAHLQNKPPWAQAAGVGTEHRAAGHLLPCPPWGPRGRRLLVQVAYTTLRETVIR